MISGLRIVYAARKNFTFFCCFLSILHRNYLGTNKNIVYGFFEHLIEDCWEIRTLFALSLLGSLSLPFNFLSTKLIFTISQTLRKYKEENDAMLCKSSKKKTFFFEIFFFVCCVKKMLTTKSLLVSTTIRIDFSHFHFDCIQLFNQRIWSQRERKLKFQAKTK